MNFCCKPYFSKAYIETKGIIIYRDLEIVTSIQRPETWDFKDHISRFLTISERWF